MLPVPLESHSVARLGPTALLSNNVSPLGRQLRGNRERLVIVGTCENEPSRWRPYRSATRPLLHSSILFRPHQQRREESPRSKRFPPLLVEAPGYCPPGPKCLFHQIVYQHSRFPGMPKIRARRPHFKELTKKDRSGNRYGDERLERV